VYFDTLVETKSGVPTLIHMLGDPRWFVARNAAALLGEMEATEAEGALADLVYHDDERVRHAATVSLMRLGTPRSMSVIEEALRDPAPQIRMQAATALLARREGRHAEPLVRALEEERDEEVQAAFLAALGRIASPEAVAQLVQTAEPDRTLFRKKPTALRLAAVKGLGEARTTHALAALRALADDRSVEVRDAARAALAGKETEKGKGEKGLF
jgi:HEAT repeat protein